MSVEENKEIPKLEDPVAQETDINTLEKKTDLSASLEKLPIIKRNKTGRLSRKRSNRPSGLE